MEQKILIIVLSTLLLTALLAVLIFMFYSFYDNFKKTYSIQKYKDVYDKKIIKKTIRVNVQKRTMHLYCDPVSGVSRKVITPENSPIYRYLDVYEKYKKKNFWLAFARVFLEIICTLLMIFLIFTSIYLRVNGDNFKINDKTYVTIMSGSMSSKNEKNTYLDELELNDQIETFALVELKELQEEDEIKNYGVYGYKDKDGTLIVHRVIQESVLSDGDTYYTFKGDANPVSDYYLVNRKDILFEYTGVKNLFLGYFISFIKTPVGITSLIYSFIALCVLDYFEKEKNEFHKWGMNQYLENLNRQAYFMTYGI